MKSTLYAVGWLLVIQGVGGTVNALLGWWRWAHDLLLVNRLPFLHGREIFAGIVIAMLGAALLMVPDARGRKAES